MNNPFNREQIEFMQERMPKVDFSQPLTDDDYVEIEETIGDILCAEGFDKNDDPKPLAFLCESILDVID